eukprot:scaffold91542_cov48-Attheya_sp.AAC.6
MSQNRGAVRQPHAPAEFESCPAPIATGRDGQPPIATTYQAPLVRVRSAPERQVVPRLERRSGLRQF